MQIAVLLYDRFTALDAVGPYEVLSRLPGARLTFVAKQPGPVTTDTGTLSIVAEKALTDVPRPDVLLTLRMAAAGASMCSAGPNGVHGDRGSFQRVQARGQ